MYSYAPKYPNDFFDFKNGVNIDDDTIQLWINKAIDFLEEHISAPYYYTSSGNTMVIVFRDNPQTDGSRYTVHASKNRAQAIIE